MIETFKYIMGVNKEGSISNIKQKLRTQQHNLKLGGGKFKVMLESITSQKE